MPTGLTRYHGTGDLHFITCSCYQRQPLLATASSRDLFLKILEETRQKYIFGVAGYVVMPEHFHLLVTEPQRANLSIVVQVLKQRVARALLLVLRPAGRQTDIIENASPALAQFWQRRFYDFNIWTEKKRIEKLRYIHRNPVTRGLVASPELWRWSSFRHYRIAETGLVRVDVVAGWKITRVNGKDPTLSFGKDGAPYDG